MPASPTGQKIAEGAPTSPTGQKAAGSAPASSVGQKAAEGTPASSSGQGSRAVWSQASLWGTSVRLGYYAAVKASVDLALKGEKPCGLSATFTLPPDTEEVVLAEMTAELLRGAERVGVPVLSVQGEVSPFVTGCGVVVTAVSASCAAAGKHKSADEAVCDRRPALDASCTTVGKRRIQAGDEILLCGYTGLEGTLRLVDEAGQELSSRFVPSFLQQARELDSLLVTPEPILRVSSLISTGIQIGSGGILGALWELAELCSIGLEADMRQMTLRQETVEICEFCHMNPYQLTSAGSCLLVTKEPARVIAVLEKEGVRASRLGTVTGQKARTVTSGEETRYLDRPAADELVRWQQERSQPQTNS